MKQIYTYVAKSLPTMNNYLKFIKTAEEWNALSKALYHFFDSELLTKSDYEKMVDVLLDKLPIYMRNNNVAQFEDIVFSYVVFNAPPNPDYQKAIHGLLTASPELNVNLLFNCLHTMNENFAKNNKFVGVEVITNSTISLTPITQAQLDSIKKMIGVR
jgi:hypothetical protein